MPNYGGDVPKKKKLWDMWRKGIPYRYNVPGLRCKDVCCFEATEKKPVRLDSMKDEDSLEGLE